MYQPIALILISIILVIVFIVVGTINQAEGFTTLSNDGMRSYKAALSGVSQGFGLSTGIVEKITVPDSDAIHLKFECSLPEPQPTFTYHNPGSECSCFDNAHWDSNCSKTNKSGNCSTYKAWVTTASGADIFIGDLARYGDGVSRVELKTESSTISDSVSAKVTLENGQGQGQMVVLEGVFL
jgi:hypothetical protein